MKIELTPEQDAFVKDAVEKGIYQSAADAVHRAMDLWVERERTRCELLAAIEEGEHSLEEDSGIVLETEEEIQNFFDEIVENGKARLAPYRRPICALSCFHARATRRAGSLGISGGRTRKSSSL